MSSVPKIMVALLRGTYRLWRLAFLGSSSPLRAMGVQPWQRDGIFPSMKWVEVDERDSTRPETFGPHRSLLGLLRAAVSLLLVTMAAGMAALPRLDGVDGWQKRLGHPNFRWAWRWRWFAQVGLVVVAEEVLIAHIRAWGSILAKSRARSPAWVCAG